MGKYSLEKLGWFNFEQLIGCLLRDIIGPGLSVFSGSYDEGRDATFSGGARFPSYENTTEGEWIFQVKHRHWGTRGVAHVRSELIGTLGKELEKVCEKHNHKCDFYVFITNCPLTASNKDDLLAIISSQDTIKTGFVFGEADIEQLLDVHPKVVRSFPQIMGIGQLKELLNWGIRQRSLSYLRQVQEELNTFVVTDAYLKALELLNEQHFCVISGAPKMGKTCTANAITASFAASNFTIIDVRSQQDFYDILDEDEDQLFICDDVFGDIALNAERRDDWSRSLSSLLRILGKKHRLLWTARTYIFKEAIEASKLAEERPSLLAKDNIVVSVNDLRRLEKAMILYNHAKKAQLPERVKEFLRSNCLKIVDHECFAPESIRQLCTGKFTEFVGNDDINEDDILAKVDRFLSSPGEAWKRAFKNSSQEEQLLCIELMSNGGDMPFDELRDKYDTWKTEAGATVLSFKDAFDRVEGSFIKRNIKWYGQVNAIFYHPSMRDLLIEIIESDKSIRDTYIQKLSFKEITSLMVGDAVLNDEEGSFEHRIRLNGDEELSMLEQHMKGNLLPRMELSDVNSVLSQFKDTVTRTKIEESANPVPARILNLVIEAACSPKFWLKYRERTPNSILYRSWTNFFSTLNDVMQHMKEDYIPLYAGQLLERYSDTDSLQFWELVIAVEKILPSIAHKHVDFSTRELLRNSLADDVQNAIAYSENELENDWESRHSWNDEYGSVVEDCQRYSVLFPQDDEIENVDELEYMLEKYPPIEPDYDRDDWYETGHRDADDSEIRDIFSDL